MEERQKKGRKTSMTPDVFAKLEKAFAIGASIGTACKFAGIGESTFYDYQQAHPEYKEIRQKLQEQRILKALETVARAINEGDVKTAIWLLERKLKDEYGQRVELTGANGDDLLPNIQIIGVPSNDGEEGK